MKKQSLAALKQEIKYFSETNKNLEQRITYFQNLTEDLSNQSSSYKDEIKKLKDFLIKGPSKWYLSDALELIQDLENRLNEIGFHCGLTGGVLFKGNSEKDLDVIIYPHKKSEESESKHENIISLLESMGMIQLKTRNEFQKEQYYDPDEKHIEIWSYQCKRIDFFFMEKNDE